MTKEQCTNTLQECLTQAKGDPAAREACRTAYHTCIRDLPGEDVLMCLAGHCGLISAEYARGHPDEVAACKKLHKGDVCGKTPNQTLACLSGKCQYVEAATPEAIAACDKHNVRDDCVMGTACESNDDCPEGYTCKDGKCVPFIPVTVIACIDNKCKETNKASTGDEAIAKCNGMNVGDDCSGKHDGDGNGDGGGGGEFQWSEKLQGLLDMLMDRIKYLFDYPRGLTDEERQGIINYAVEGAKRSERPRLQATRDELARMGLLGSGFQATETGRIRRGTSEMVTNLKRQVAIDELDRRFKELMGTTGMAQGLLGTAMESQRLPEVLSGGRRAESQGALGMLMSYLSNSMNFAGGMMPSWLGALMNQANTSGGQASGFGSWLPWFSWLMTSQLGGGKNQRYDLSSEGMWG